MTRRHLINALAGLVLGLLVLLRRSFTAAIGGDRTQAKRIRPLLAPALLVFVVFLAVATWTLVEAGYPVVALLLVVHIVLVLSRAWA